MWMGIKKLCVPESLKYWAWMSSGSDRWRWSTLPFRVPERGVWDLFSGLWWLPVFCCVVSCMVTMPCLVFPGCQESDPALRNAGHVAARGAVHADRRRAAQLLPALPLLRAALLRRQEGTALGKGQVALCTQHWLVAKCGGFSFLPLFAWYYIFSWESFSAE